jgi:hypothetical protein
MAEENGRRRSDLHKWRFRFVPKKMRSDSECRIRRNVGRMEGNERLGRTRQVARKCCIRRGNKYKNDVYQYAAELQETSV